jgi:hypothetical protein
MRRDKKNYEGKMTFGSIMRRRRRKEMDMG